MHQKRATDGLVAMAVSLDEPDDAPALARARQFLADQNADFPCFVLAEPQARWQEKFGILGPPAVFVFGRDGKLVKKFDEGVDYGEINKLVEELLKKQ